MRELTIIGFISLFTFIALADTWASRHKQQLIPLNTLIARLLSDRTVRVSFAIIWWWIGWHFLFSKL